MQDKLFQTLLDLRVQIVYLEWKQNISEHYLQVQPLDLIFNTFHVSCPSPGAKSFMVRYFTLSEIQLKVNLKHFFLTSHCLEFYLQIVNTFLKTGFY
jgi:hypothetical protein